MRLSREAFERLLREALAGIPEPFKGLIYNVEISVRAAPGREAGRRRGSPTLLGLYDGMTREEMLRSDAGSYLPARIVLYRRNLERGCKTEGELATAIRTTLRHELAHHFGFSDADLRARWPEGA